MQGGEEGVLKKDFTRRGEKKFDKIENTTNEDQGDLLKKFRCIEKRQKKKSTFMIPQEGDPLGP